MQDIYSVYKSYRFLLKYTAETMLWALSWITSDDKDKKNLQIQTHDERQKQVS